MPEISSAKLVINVCPIEVPDVEINVGVTRCSDNRDKLNELRASSDPGLVFRQENSQFGLGPAILSASSNADLKPIGDIFSLRLRDNLQFTAVLARSAFVSHLVATDRSVFGYHPILFASKAAEKNLLYGLGKQPPEWLSVRPLVSANIRVFQYQKDSPFLGLALDLRMRRYVQATCAELLEQGFDLNGLFVSQRETHHDQRITTEPKLIGQVAEVRGDKLVLTNARDGIESIAAHDAYVERREGFDRVMRHVYGEQTDPIKQKLSNKISKLQSGGTVLKTLVATQQYFSNQKIEIHPSVPLFIRPMLSSADKGHFPSVRAAPPAKFLFDSAGRELADSGLKGIRRFGPYSRHTFDRNHLQICVVCQSTKKGLFDKFLHSFLNGIKSHGNQQSAYQNGFVSDFKLADAKVTFFCCKSDTSEDYLQASNDAVSFAEDENIRWDIAFVQIDDSFKDRTSDLNPYLICKKAFLTHQIPVQAIRTSTAAKSDKPLSYVMNNVALAAYAKLNGTPWLLQSSPTVTHEFVIGLGSSYISNNSKLDERERVVGITTVFQSDGSYFLSDVTQSASIDEFSTVLLDTLRRVLKQVIQPTPRSSVRLIFHAFKPLKNTEVEAVKALVNEQCDFDTEFAFIHVVDDPQYRIFDTSQHVQRSYQNGAKRGEFAPKRGNYLQLSEWESLLVTTGPTELRRSTDGLPRPILLRLHRDSTFSDMTYLTRQAFHFTSHSWQTVSPTSLPVTIYYSHLIAKRLGQLSTLSIWDPDVLLGRIGRTRWFL